VRFDVQTFINHPHVLTKRRDGLVIFNYDHGCTYDKAWDDITMQARGLILEEATGEVIFRNMRKFFNLNEIEETRYENLPTIGFTATEKLDGYLGCAFKWRDLWHVATRGSFDSEMAQWATPWFRANVRTDAMDPEYSYHFEIIYSRKIVISYDFEGLVLLTAVHKETGAEMPYRQLVLDGKSMGVRVAPLMPQFESVLKLAEYVKGLPSNREGCVVTFSSGLKVKIKGEEYCRIHKIVSRMTPLAFWEAYDKKTGRIPKEYLYGIPEEFRETSDALVKAIEDSIEKSMVDVGAACKRVEESLPFGADNKTFALKTRDMYPDLIGWIMSYRDGKFEKLRTALHRRHRPTNNELSESIPGLDRVLRVNEEG
jgi:RNA ligase